MVNAVPWLYLISFCAVPSAPKTSRGKLRKIVCCVKSIFGRELWRALYLISRLWERE